MVPTIIEMNNFQVTKQLFLDAAPVAEAIEAQLGAYLLPPEQGIYLPTSGQPVMRPHNFYYQLKRTSANAAPQKVAVTAIEEIASDVYDAEDVVVVPAKLAKYVKLEPALPARGLAVLSTAVDWTLTGAAAWSKRDSAPLTAFLADHLKDEHRKDDVVLQRLSDLTLDLRYDTRQFVGQDLWVIHIHSQRGRDIVVEKTVDFRIFDWERRMASGEWK